MKKAFILLAILYAFAVSAQTLDPSNLVTIDLGEFSSFGTNCKASAYFTKDSASVVYYRIEATMTHPTNFKYEKHPCFDLIYTPDLMDKLKSVVCKYREWDKIARENNVGKFDKNIEIEIPQFVAFETQSTNKKSSVDFEMVKIEDNHKFKFLFNGMEKPSVLSFIIKDRRKSNLMPYFIVLSFKGIDEINNFLKYIDPQHIKERIKTNSTGSLFK